jgi:hypothetical protein
MYQTKNRERGPSIDLYNRVLRDLYYINGHLFGFSMMIQQVFHMPVACFEFDVERINSKN